MKLIHICVAAAKAAGTAEATAAKAAGTVTAALLAMFLFSCNKDFIGNPHKHATAHRAVAIAARDIRVEPDHAWTGIKDNQVKILVKSPGIGAYNLKIGKTTGIKLLKVDLGESTDAVFVTLKISPKAPAQIVAIQCSKGDDFFAFPFRIEGPAGH